jgi:hypothetical protein
MSPGAVGLTFASMLSRLLRAKVASRTVPDDRNLLLFSLPAIVRDRPLRDATNGTREPQSKLTGSLLV